MAVQVKKTWDEQRLTRDRLAQLQQQIRRRGIGALYLADGLGIRYLLDMKVPAGQIFVPPEGDALALIRPRDMGYVKMRHPNARLPLYKRDAIADDSGAGEEAKRFAQGIIDLMAEHGVAGEQLGVVGLNTANLLACIEAEIHIVDAEPILERAQSVKTQDEVTIYHTIAEQYVYAFNVFRDAIRPGASEIEVVSAVTTAWIDAGGEEVSQINVCSGENMNPWRRWPTERTIKDNEFVGLDLHGRGACGLRGDSGTTFFVGDRPTTEQRDLYRRAYEYLQASTDIFRAGRTFAEILASAPPVPEKYQKQLYNYHVGHGVGMWHSGYPHISKQDFLADDVLQPNQVIAVECHFGEEGSPLTVKLEQMLLVREGPPEVLGAGIPVDERLLS